MAKEISEKLEKQSKKIYELDGYALRAVVRDNNLIPILRSARGDERYTLTKLVKESLNEPRQVRGVMKPISNPGAP